MSPQTTFSISPFGCFHQMKTQVGQMANGIQLDHPLVAISNEIIGIASINLTDDRLDVIAERTELCPVAPPPFVAESGRGLCGSCTYRSAERRHISEALRPQHI